MNAQPAKPAAPKASHVESGKPRIAQKRLPRELPEAFQILVACANEAEQEQMYDRLIAEGWRCRVITL